MTNKKIKLFFKKNNGVTGIDLSLSVIIILIFIPTIFASVYVIQKTNNSINRKTTALNIATNVLEMAKSTDYEEIALSSESDFVNKITSKYTQKEASDYTTYYYNSEDDTYYKINLDVLNYYPEGADEQDLIKKVTVQVIYMVENQEENVEISTYIEKNNI